MAEPLAAMAVGNANPFLQIGDISLDNEQTTALVKFSQAFFKILNLELSELNETTIEKWAQWAKSLQILTNPTKLEKDKTLKAFKETFCDQLGTLTKEITTLKERVTSVRHAFKTSKVADGHLPSLDTIRQDYIKQNPHITYVSDNENELFKQLKERIKEDRGLTLSDQNYELLTLVFDQSREWIDQQMKEYHARTEEFRKMEEVVTKALADYKQAIYDLSFEYDWTTTGLHEYKKPVSKTWFTGWWKLGSFQYFAGILKPTQDIKLAPEPPKDGQAMQVPSADKGDDSILIEGNDDDNLSSSPSSGMAETPPQAQSEMID